MPTESLSLYPFFLGVPKQKKPDPAKTASDEGKKMEQKRPTEAVANGTVPGRKEHHGNRIDGGSKNRCYHESTIVRTDIYKTLFSDTKAVTEARVCKQCGDWVVTIDEVLKKKLDAENS